MGYPVWQTRAGDLGTVPALQFYQLTFNAVDPDGKSDGTDVTYSLVSGNLPRGMQLDSSGTMIGSAHDKFSIDGVPFAVDKDITSSFTIRATSLTGEITDRSFKMTITGNFPPQILTPSVIDSSGNTVPSLPNKNNYTLGYFIDGTELFTIQPDGSKLYGIQLRAVDLNNDSVSFSLMSGKLPPGLTMDSNGFISGVFIPNVTDNANQISGWDESKWGQNAWQFTTRSGNFGYEFTVKASDGKSYDAKTYKIYVYASNDLTADNTVISADNTFITGDLFNKRVPVLLTKTIGDHTRFRSGNYFSFKFEGIDYDNVPVQYELTGANNTGWDNEGPWDTNAWELTSFTALPGVSLDPYTGWMTGFIPESAAPEQTYTFGISVANLYDITLFSDTRQFTVTVLGALDLTLNWITPSNLGTIDGGSVSQLSIQAQAPSGRELYYTLYNTNNVGSKLPQGLTLLPDGNISGRCTFQAFNLDAGKTTFDQRNQSAGIYTKSTTFDKTFTFTVFAQDYDKTVGSEKTFTLEINSVTFEPYDNLYVLCRPNKEKRYLLSEILGNTDYFRAEDIYRPNDPYWGLQTEIKSLVAAGISSSTARQYITAMQTRHYDKKFYFGDYRLAKAKDKNGNYLYDVIYVDLLEDTKVYTTKNGLPNAVSPAGSVNLNNAVSTWHNPRAIDANNLLNVVNHNDLNYMQDDLISSLGYSNSDTLPEWQTTIQDNGKVLGFISAAVLVYLKPGTGAKTLFTLKSRNIYDIKTVPFVADRYLLDNNQDKNFNLTTRTWAKKSFSTLDNHYNTAITPVATVDFAIDLPFEIVNNSTVVEPTEGWDNRAWDNDASSWDETSPLVENYSLLNDPTLGWDGLVFDSDGDTGLFDYTPNSVISEEDYVASLSRVRINELGGFDGTITDYNNKIIVFSRQEKYSVISTDYAALTNDGWNLEGAVVPGYADKIGGYSAANQRGGMWLCKVVNNVLKLSFLKEIEINQAVRIRYGQKAGQLWQYNARDVGAGVYTVPHYTRVSEANYEKINYPTTFDGNKTRLLNNVDQYQKPFADATYLKFPKSTIFS